MEYFKYILFTLLTLISTSSYSAYSCGVGANVTLTSELDDYPPEICADTGAGNCVVIENHSLRQNNGTWIIYATSTGEGCLTPTNLNAPPLDDGCERTANGSIVCPEEEEEEEQNPVLQCTADSCLNPENKRCPTGYTGGAFNGQSMCVKNNDPDPECQGDECGNEEQEVVAAVNDAKFSITGAISDLNNSLGGILNQIKNALYDISDTIADSSNGGDGGDGDGDCEDGCGQGGETGEVDTSGLEAEAPFIESYESDNSQFETDLFDSNPECPADQVLNMSFMGSTIHYAFSYAEICDALHGLSFLVMIFAYLIAAYIVTRA